jgi:hypothetical protein
MFIVIAAICFIGFYISYQWLTAPAAAPVLDFFQNSPVHPDFDWTKRPDYVAPPTVVVAHTWLNKSNGLVALFVFSIGLSFSMDAYLDIPTSLDSLLRMTHMFVFFVSLASVCHEIFSNFEIIARYLLFFRSLVFIIHVFANLHLIFDSVVEAEQEFEYLY